MTMSESHKRHTLEFSSPIGQLQLVSEGDYVIELNWEGQHREIIDIKHNTSKLLTAAARELDLYFNGAITEFTVPRRPKGTAFQVQVWNELRHIQWGLTSTYLEIAQRIGKPRGSRAVGTAIGRNPLPLIIPCHRVIGSNGSLTGFSGGLDIKARLLSLENESTLML